MDGVLMTTLTPRKLRQYQTEAVDAVLWEWGNERRSTAVVLPTGTGKSTVIASVAAAAARMGLRVVMLAHRAELLDQMAAAVAALDPTLEPVGIVRALEDQHAAQIVAASLQTLTNRKRAEALGERQVILWDEVHHGGAESWVQVLEGFGLRQDDRPFFCGFTATLRREDGKALRRIIDTVAYEKDLRWAIGEGYLVKPEGLTVQLPNLDLGKVKVRAGDFAGNDLAEVMEGETPEVVKAIARHAFDRRAIVFAASVQGAYDIADGLVNSHGIRTDVITGSMSYEQRQPIYEDFRSGEIQMMVTVQVLTEGADFPMCDCVVIARPTQSQNLYSQMVGRALRLYTAPDGTEKTDALVLDLVGSSRVLKLVTLSNLDAGTTSRTVDDEGHEIVTEDDPLSEADLGLEKAMRQRRLGPIETIGIDLLGPDQTPVLWLATRKGIPFAVSGSRMVFLWEVGYDEHGPLYKVGDMTIKGAKEGGWLDDGRAWPLQVAREIAEDQFYEWGTPPPQHNARWRMQSDRPSEAQIRFARNLRVTDPENMTKGRLSDEISIALASARLDGSR
jgi:superfamily II DNA or RNA helicase